MKSPALEEMIDVKAVDWNRVWRARRTERSTAKRDSGFWDGRAASFAKAASSQGYSGCFLAIMDPWPEWSVLDMGCGSGTLALPLSHMVSSVTAVDFSPEMLAIVRKRCEEDGIGNVTTIRARWEDDWSEAGIGSYDVAIASRSMVADDLRSSVLKLDAAARKRVYIATIVGDGPFDRSLFEAVGRPLVLGPDYIYNYNLLYQTGILANVTFIEEKRAKTYDTPEDVLTSAEWMFFGGLSGGERERLRSYVREHLVYKDGAWGLSYNNTVRWAVIWWEKG